MTIGSVEELEALPIGSVITVRDTAERQWTRDHAGWMREGVPSVPSSFFEGLAADGRVTDWASAGPEPGSVYRTGSTWVLVTQVKDNVVTYLTWRGETFRVRSSATIDQVRGWRGTRKVAPGDVPEWLRVLRTNIGLLRQYEEFVEASVSAADQVATLRREMEAMRVAQPGTVRVHVTGTGLVPVEKSDGHVPKDVAVTEVVAQWSTDLAFDVSGEGCLCDQVNEAMIRERLGIDPEYPGIGFTYSTDCGRH